MPRHPYEGSYGSVQRFVKSLRKSEPNIEFLELVLQDKRDTREQRSNERRVEVASFHETRSLDNFDFGFNLHSGVGATCESNLFV